MNKALIIGLVAVLGAGCASYPQAQRQPLYGNPYMNPLTGAGAVMQGQGLEYLQMMQDPGYIPMPTGPTPMERQQQEIQDFHRHQELIRSIEGRNWRR